MRPAEEAADGPPDPGRLLARAREIRARAHAPYSQLRVGAVVVIDDGRIFDGVNVENAAFGSTICAEQAAVAAMVAAAGARVIVAVAVVGDGQRPCTPCGACRQVLHEFGPGATVYASGDGGRPLVTTLAELLPHGFGPRRLADGRGGPA